MERWKPYLSAALIALATFPVTAALASVDKDTQEHAARLLRDYVEDYRDDVTATESAIFAVRITDVGEWHIQVKGRAEPDARAGVTLHSGLPQEPAAPRWFGKRKPQKARASSLRCAETPSGPSRWSPTPTPRRHGPLMSRSIR